jgi:hypothetical protein
LAGSLDIGFLRLPIGGHSALDVVTGKDLGRIFDHHYHSYGLLMNSFEAKNAKES